MSGKRKRETSSHGSGIPTGALAADRSKHLYRNSWEEDSAPSYYLDIDFVCVECGKSETWTKQQQKWYYEEAKGCVLATAIRCRGCRNKIKDEKTLRQT